MKYQKLILIILLSCCSGPSYLFIKVGVKTIPPMTLVFFRVFIAALTLFTLLKLQRKKLWSYRKHAKHFFVMGCITCVLPFFLIMTSEKTISSSLAGLLNGSVPIFAGVLAHFTLPNDRLSVQKTIGILLGIIGLAFVLVPSLEQSYRDTQGTLMVILASVAYGVGIVYSKKYLQGLPSLIASTWQLIMASLVALPLCFLLEKPLIVPLVGFEAIASVLGLAWIGSALAFIFYYRLIEVADPSYLSYSTLLAPLIALALGVWILGEHLTWNAYVGGALILSGLGITTQPIKRKKIYEMA
ncbi:DMT family transporter [Simkania negevensis]|nr:DMT family transporter [Simkania negevensis]